MKRSRHGAWHGRAATLSLLLLAAISASAWLQAWTQPIRPRRERSVSAHARGTFEVTLTPQPGAADAVPGRLTIAKRWHGDFEGTSEGEMLAAQTATQGSAGYVAIERVRGRLAGRTGSFVLQHSGIMDRGSPTLTITVIPDSGTEGLTGLAGRMTIQIEPGKHSYEFDYSLAE